MKTQNLVIVGLLTLGAVVGLNYNQGWAEVENDGPVRTGVVNIGEIFETSKKHKEWQESMSAYEKKVQADMEKLATEIKAIDADIKTREPGSEDYFNLTRQSNEKKAAYEARGKFRDQEMVMKMQYWSEKLYKQIIDSVEKVAKDKGLDVVLTKEEPSFPARDMQDLMTTIKTNAVIYNSDRVDITDAVLATLDSQP